MYSAYPYQRDPQNFTDYLSSTFPPFVLCRLEKRILVNNERVEDIACHLLLMELYEKIFMVLWVWLAVVTACTCLAVVCLLLATLPPFSRMFLNLRSNSSKIKKLKRKVLKICDVGDLYVLYLLKKHRSDGQFVMFMDKFTHNYELEEVKDKLPEASKNPDQGFLHGSSAPWGVSNHSVENYGWTTMPAPPPQLPIYYPQDMQLSIEKPCQGSNVKKRHFQSSTPYKQSVPPLQVPHSRSIRFSDVDSF